MHETTTLWKGERKKDNKKRKKKRKEMANLRLLARHSPDMNSPQNAAPGCFYQPQLRLDKIQKRKERRKKKEEEKKRN